MVFRTPQVPGGRWLPPESDCYRMQQGKSKRAGTYGSETRMWVVELKGCQSGTKLRNWPSPSMK